MQLQQSPLSKFVKEAEFKRDIAFCSVLSERT